MSQAPYVSNFAILFLQLLLSFHSNLRLLACHKVMTCVCSIFPFIVSPDVEQEPDIFFGNDELHPCPGLSHNLKEHHATT